MDTTLTWKNVLFSKGNHKLPRSTAIINITSAHDCPAKKKGMCPVPDGKCYAMKAERPYRPKCLSYRRRQTVIWDALPAWAIAAALIKHSENARKYKITKVRFSESGDFRNQKDVNKMSRVAEILKYAEIPLYGYTARKDLDYSKVSDNMIITGSGFMVHNSFNVVPKDKLKKYKHTCKMNCSICNLCAKRRKIKIYAPLH